MLCKACNIGKINDYNNGSVSGLIAADCVGMFGHEGVLLIGWV